MSSMRKSAAQYAAERDGDDVVFEGGYLDGQSVRREGVRAAGSRVEAIPEGEAVPQRQIPADRHYAARHPEAANHGPIVSR